MSKIATLKRLRSEHGVRGIAIGVFEKILHKLKAGSRPVSHVVAGKTPIGFLAKTSDILAVDVPNKTFTLPTHDGPYSVNWVLHPGGESSGGTQNIFRFIKFLEDAGHTCTIYFYATREFTLEEMYKNTAKNYDKVKAEFKYLDGPMDKADAIFATGWETAYPVYNDPSEAMRFYFVQDYEPLFSYVGSEYVLAENTYSFGFHGITAGKWLASTLQEKYSMPCDHFDFGTEAGTYRHSNKETRNKVFFYARPVTPRRAFELGVLALSEFHTLCPDVEIVMAGWDVSHYDIDFPYTNLSIMDISELSDIYNECAAALVLSLTNMSLLPLELLGCGVIPVMNEGKNNRMVSDSQYIHYSHPSPKALARSLKEVVERKDQADYATKASQSVAGLSWSLSGEQFTTSFEKVMRG